MRGIDPAEVKTICAHLGITTEKPLTNYELHMLTSYKDGESIQTAPRVAPPTCDCGQPGVHKWGHDWECERCFSLRRKYPKRKTDDYG